MDIDESLVVTCAECDNEYDWGENPGPCPKCGSRAGTYKNRPVSLATGHEQ